MEAILVGLGLVLVLGMLHLPLLLLDLRGQPTEVARMWVWPTVLLGAGCVLLFGLGWMLADHGLDAARTLSRGYLALGLLGWACGTVAGCGIAIARWLRPGGTVQVHPGTMLVGTVVTAVLFVPGVALATEASWGALLLAVPPLLVILTLLTRDGPERLQEGRRTAVSALVLGFGVVTVAFGFASWLEGTSDRLWVGASACWLLSAAWASLTVRLRGWVFGGMALDLACLAGVMLYQSTATAFPPELGAPLAEDWWSEPTDQFAIDQLDCFEVAGSGTRFGDCESQVALVMDSTNSTAALLEEKEKKPYLIGLALGRGEAMIRWAEDPPPAPQVTVIEGRPHYRGRPISREILRAHPPDQPLWLQASPDLNLVQLTRFCATATTGNRCGVMRGG